MRSKLLMTSAAAALLAGTVLAAAQTPRNADQPAAGQQGETSKPMQGQGGSQAQQPREGQRGQGQNRDRNLSTSGQGGQQGGQTQQNEQGQQTPPRNREQGQTQRREDRPAGQTQNQENRNQQGQQGQSQQRSGSGASANLTTEQRTKIRETVIRGSNAPRVTNVNFSINVGTVVPRSVHVVAVPSVIVEIHPEWRGFMYFVYNDEIIIVEPDSLKIVAVFAV